MTPTEGQREGQKRAERGIKRAAHAHELQILKDILRFLDALLASSDGCATTDAAVDNLELKHDDGGMWRATVPKRLRAEGLIAFDAVVKSCRKFRNSGYVTRWRLIDRTAAAARLLTLAAEIDTHLSASKNSSIVELVALPKSGGETK